MRRVSRGRTALGSTPIVGALILTLAILAGQACSRAWERFEYPECGCSVELPDKPQEAIQAIDAPTGSVKLRLYYVAGNTNIGEALVGGNLFLVYSTETPRFAGDTDLLPHLEKKVTEALKGKITARSTIAVEGYSGVELAVEGRNTKYRARILEGHGHLYALVADSASLGSLSADAFFVSLRPTTATAGVR
jgi:hypothetical protein